jgi:hypothetical protein
MAQTYRSYAIAHAAYQEVYGYLKGIWPWS